MECNKDEAIRAKEIAEQHMQAKKFQAARRLLQKAQKLYSELENVQQMLMVCDVHCAAKEISIQSSKEILIDWYGILQIGHTADEATVKKQYRKFALQLHPDKNKFPGAEAAFKLVGEAQRVLVDHAKRSAFDIKRRIAVGAPAYQPAQKQSLYPHGVGQGTANFTGVDLQQPKQWPPHQGFSNGQSTFWTKCPYCLVKYEYRTDVLHRYLRCQKCTKNFIAYDSGSIPQPTNLNQPNFSQQRAVQNHGISKVKEESHGTSLFQNSKVPNPSRGSGSVDAGVKRFSGKHKRKLSVDSSDTVDSESSRETEGVAIDRKGGNGYPSGSNSKLLGEQNLRRSGRRKQEVSYKEKLSDDDHSSIPSKKAKMCASSCATEVTGDRIRESHSVSDAKSDHQEHRKCGVFSENEEVVTASREGMAEENDLKRDSKNGRRTAKGTSNADSADMDDVHTKTEIYEYPDPEFNDFDKDKKEGCFSAGQIWAIYDTLDAMPRFYARIRKVVSPGFKLRITWLEPNPDSLDDTEWVNEGLPASCGNFIHGNTEYTENHPMFSHMMLWEGGKCRDSYRVLPRKGETWALFKNWDMNWKSDATANMSFKYEFVEILSEYAEGVGSNVARLAKLKGFVSVFCRVFREGMDTFQIPPYELFRFSHRVPSYVLSGQEREGLPKGSFELDPAALTDNLEEISLPEGFKMELGNRYVSSSSSSKKQTPVAELVDPSPKGRRKFVLDSDDDDPL